MSNINPSKLIGTISATGTGNAIGPFKFRVSSGAQGLSLAVASTNTTDVVQVVGVFPGASITAAANLLVSVSQTCPGIVNLVGEGSKVADADYYVYGTTTTGTITASFQLEPAHSRV